MSRPRNALQFTSPRCEVDDDRVFLPNEESLKEHEDRWKHMSQQAGEHSVPDSVLDLTSRRTSPQTLKVGVPPQVAARVVELHVNMLQDYGLPEWLDVVSSLFFQLQHLYTGTKDDCHDMEGARMRRLYILYRLPDLLSIDGKQVTELERQLARPSSPNGHKVKREDWVSVQESDSNGSEAGDSEYSLDDLMHGDAVEVSLFGVVKRVNADPPKEEWDEPELQKPYEPRVEEQIQSVTKSVERAYRSMTKIPKEAKSVSPPQVDPNARTCGNFKLLVEGPLGGNPCVNRSRAVLDEPDTIDYKADANATSPATPSKRNRTRSQSLNTPPSRQKSLQEQMPSPERIERPITPDRASPKPTTPTSSTSLSSPFPIQFRSKSFNGAVPPPRHGLKRESSSPELSDKAKKQLEVKCTTRGTIDSSASPTFLPSPTNSIRQRLERPPPCPGARRVVPDKKGKLSRWRNKSAIRATSIVDDVDDDEDWDESTEEEEIMDHY